MAGIVDWQVARMMLVGWERAGLRFVALVSGLFVVWMMARGVLCLRELRPGGLRDPGSSPEGIVEIEWQRTRVLSSPLLLRTRPMVIVGGVARGMLRLCDSRAGTRRHPGLEDIVRIKR